jgi:hypothetical protein
MVLPAAVLVNRSERGLLIIKQGAQRAPVLVAKALCAASSRPRPPDETFARARTARLNGVGRYLGRKSVKPTPMQLEDALLDLTNRGEIVLDPFLGSGSTFPAYRAGVLRCQAGSPLCRPHYSSLSGVNRHSRRSPRQRRDFRTRRAPRRDERR